MRYKLRSKATGAECEALEYGGLNGAELLEQLPDNIIISEKAMIIQTVTGAAEIKLNHFVLILEEHHRYLVMDSKYVFEFYDFLGEEGKRRLEIRDNIRAVIDKYSKDI